MELAVVAVATLAAAATLRLLIGWVAPGFFPKANRSHVTADMTYTEREAFWSQFTPEEQKRAAERGIY